MMATVLSETGVSDSAVMVGGGGSGGAMAEYVGTIMWYEEEAKSRERML